MPIRKYPKNRPGKALRHLLPQIQAPFPEPIPQRIAIRQVPRFGAVWDRIRIRRSLMWKRTSDCRGVEVVLRAANLKYPCLPVASIQLLTDAPYKVCPVIVGAVALDGPSVQSARMEAGRRGRRPLRICIKKSVL